MVRKALEAIGAERCVYVGDSDVDILTAKNAGVPCLSVTWGFRGEAELRDAGALYFCHDPADLPETIEEIMKQW
jgi:phosphoglycolate phosphatase